MIIKLKYSFGIEVRQSNRSALVIELSANDFFKSSALMIAFSNVVISFSAIVNVLFRFARAFSVILF